MIKAILFDFGDVLLKSKSKGILIKNQIKEVTKALGVDYDTFETIRKEYHQDLRKGKMPFLEFGRVLKEKLNLQVNANEIVKVWERCYLKISVPNYALLKVAKKLKKHYKVGLISNIYDLTARTDRKRGLFDIFEPCILSCKVGLEKPQKEIFNLALRKINLKPKECIFIDNEEEYLVVAKELGFRTILFRNNKQLIRDLKSFGIKI